MEKIGTYEAKTHFSKLIQRIIEGESIVITYKGEPVAVMSPTNEWIAHERRKAVDALIELKKTSPLGSPEEIITWKNEGAE